MIDNISRAKDGGMGLTAHVPSHTEPGVTYTVVRSNEGEWRCTCPHNFIRKVECKHIDEVMTEVYRQDLTREPRLFIVQFRTYSAGNREAVVIATTTEEAKTKFHRTYSRMRFRVESVIETDREVLVR